MKFDNIVNNFLAMYFETMTAGSVMGGSPDTGTIAPQDKVAWAPNDSRLPYENAKDLQKQASKKKKKGKIFKEVTPKTLMKMQRRNIQNVT